MTSRRFVLLCCTTVAVLATSLASHLGVGRPAPWAAVQRTLLQETLGIETQGISLSAAGHLLDFRYRIIDPDKALAFVDRRFKPYLIDEASGAHLAVPAPPKVGPLRQTSKYGKPRQGRVYFVLFGNPGGLVKRGNKVTVVIGDVEIPGLVVQ